jgi:hypothetical protein
MIRESKMLYVDKTALIYTMVRVPSYIFLSRPRRFGKSLLVSTIHCYFEGRKDLFEGLAMEKLEKNWNQYPILHFDFSRVKKCPPDALQKEINNMLSEYDASYGLETTGLLGNRLDKLIRALYKKTGKQVVLLIDEYDAPIMNVIHKADVLQEVRNVMCDFYTSLKANNVYLRFVFITGVSTFSQMGIFSELNNLDVISDDDDYAAICGITEQELRDNFKQGIDAIAKKRNWSEEETLARLKDMYDGYHFSGDLVDVYNPFSLIKAIKSKLLGNYWFNTGTTSSLVESFKQYIGDFNLELDSIDSDKWFESSDFRRSIEDRASIIPLLYQTGYLTIKKYDTDSNQYVLGMPNAEVRVGMLKNLLPIYLSINEKVISAPAKDASEALLGGDINRAMEILRSLLKSIPYGKNETKKFHDIKTTEQYYHDLFHFFFSMMCDLVNSEVRHATGATDVVITAPKYIYVVEIKIKSSPDAALKQIDEKGYAVPYMAGHRAVIKVGANFSTKEKTLSGWKVVEAKGITL